MILPWNTTNSNYFENTLSWLWWGEWIIIFYHELWTKKIIPYWYYSLKYMNLIWIKQNISRKRSNLTSDKHTCRFMYNHAYRMYMFVRQSILENYLYWHKTNADFMWLKFALTHFRNYLKFSNVSPLYIVLIPCPALATFFVLFFNTAFHIFNRHMIFKHFCFECLSYYCHLIHLSLGIWNEIIILFLFW